MQPKNNLPEENDPVGKRIRVARKARGLTQEALGEAMGVAKASIARWETTTRTPGGPAMLALAKALQVPLEWLIAGKGGVPNSPEDKLANLIKSRRLRLKQIIETQPDLNDFAERCSVNVQYLMQASHAWHDGLTLDEALRIAHAAKKSPAWLLFGEDPQDVLYAPDVKFLSRYRDQSHLLPGPDPIPSAPTPPSEHLGDTSGRRQRLEQILKAQIDLRALAAKAEVSEASLRDYLSGKRTLNFDQVAKIAIAAGLSLNWLLLGDQIADAIQF